MGRDGHCAIGIVLQRDNAFEVELYAMAIDKWSFDVA
jgi:hypothetical protein